MSEIYQVFGAHYECSRDLALLWRRDMLRTSGFVADIVFAHYGHRHKRHEKYAC